MKPHKQAEILRAIADGKEVEYWYQGEWARPTLTINPLTYDCFEWRIKPARKTDIIRYVSHVHCNGDTYLASLKRDMNSDLKITFDGETWKIKTVEVING